MISEFLLSQAQCQTFQDWASNLQRSRAADGSQFEFFFKTNPKRPIEISVICHITGKRLTLGEMPENTHKEKFLISDLSDTQKAAIETMEAAFPGCSIPYSFLPGGLGIVTRILFDITDYDRW